jgi:hypothetical protein
MEKRIMLEGRLTCAENEKKLEEERNGIEMDACEIGERRRGSATGNIVTGNVVVISVCELLARARQCSENAKDER